MVENLLSLFLHLNESPLKTELAATATSAEDSHLRKAPSRKKRQKKTKNKQKKHRKNTEKTQKNKKKGVFQHHLHLDMVSNTLVHKRKCRTRIKHAGGAKKHLLVFPRRHKGGFNHLIRTKSALQTHRYIQMMLIHSQMCSGTRTNYILAFPLRLQRPSRWQPLPVTCANIYMLLFCFSGPYYTHFLLKTITLRLLYIL